jgi:hypothetical protein
MSGKRSALFSAVFAILLTLTPCFASAQMAPGSGTDASASANARTVITILPKKDGELLPTVNTANVAVKVDNKPASAASLSHFGSGSANLELVLLVDDSARSSLGLYLKEMSTFLTSLPPTAAVAVAYIDNGAPRFLSPFTTDHAAAAKTLRLTAGPAGISSDPYFALTALVDGWPSHEAGMRHEVVMISDGVDPYYGLRYDPENPYVTKALGDAQKHNVVVYSIFYKDRGRADRFGIAINSGQNYLIQLSEGTGGEAYYIGYDNPVSFSPFFSEISRNLMNQYELGVSVPAKVKDGLQSLKVKVNAPNTKTMAASDIFIGEPVERR